MTKNKAIDALIGMAVGDALGVPVEFLSRDTLKLSPVVGMRGYGSHNQPIGTWSDDSSLAFCLAESLRKGYDLNDIANNFLKWYEENYWTPRGEVFDIGVATSNALRRLRNGTKPILAGGADESENGNGSLMRILPLIFYTKNKAIEERFRLVKEVSSITHAHIRSVLSCFIYTEYALELLKGTDKLLAFEKMKERVNNFLESYKVCSEEERHKFHRLLAHPNKDLDIRPVYEYAEQEVYSSGYVLHTLEASFWCFLTTNSYADAVLKAVNLGSDTDTTGCVTGGLAGLYYGIENIPKEWLDSLVKKDAILQVAEDLWKAT